MPKDTSDIFAEDDAKFFVLGAFSGYTRNKVKRMVTDNGGVLALDYSDVDLKRVIISDATWAAEGGPAASLIVKAIKKANTQNLITPGEDEDEDDVDEHANRVFLLPIEWLVGSIEANSMLDDAEYDLEFTAEAAKEKRKKELAAERKKNGGVSKFGRGGRARWEREQKFREAQKELKEYERAEAEQAKEAPVAAAASASAYTSSTKPYASGPLVSVPTRNPHAAAAAHGPFVPVRLSGSIPQPVISYLNKPTQAPTHAPTHAPSRAPSQVPSNFGRTSQPHKPAVVAKPQSQGKDDEPDPWDLSKKAKKVHSSVQSKPARQSSSNIHNSLAKPKTSSTHSSLSGSGTSIAASGSRTHSHAHASQPKPKAPSSGSGLVRTHSALTEKNGNKVAPSSKPIASSGGSSVVKRPSKLLEPKKSWVPSSDSDASSFLVISDSENELPPPAKKLKSYAR